MLNSAQALLNSKDLAIQIILEESATAVKVVEVVVPSKEGQYTTKVVVITLQVVAITHKQVAITLKEVATILMEVVINNSI